MNAVAKEQEKRRSSEVSAKASRRTYSKKYKLSVLEKADACTQKGEVSALLRREGLYSSHLTAWRQARERGELQNARKRGPRPKEVSQRRLQELERENARLKVQLEKAEMTIAIQKKIAALLGEND